MNVALGMSRYKKEQIASLPSLYKRLELEYGVSEGDMPELSKLSSNLQLIDWARLKAVTRDQMKNIDRLINFELSKVLAILPRPESLINLGADGDSLPSAKTSRSVSVVSPLEALCGHDTPFDKDQGERQRRKRLLRHCPLTVCWRWQATWRLSCVGTLSGLARGSSCWTPSSRRGSRSSSAWGRSMGGSVAMPSKAT